MKKRNPRTELASALRESEAKYRQVVERANDGIVIAQRGKLVFSNKGFARMSAYPVEELDGIEFLKLVPPERRAEIADRVKRRLAGEDVPATYEIDLVRKDGTVFSVEVNAGVIEYQGEPGDLIILRDITERKQTENQSRRQTAILSTLLNSPQETVALLDRDGTVLNINLNGAIKFGMSPEEMVGKNIYELIPEPVSSERKRIIAEAMRTGQPAHFEDQRQNLHLMNSVYPVNDPQSGELLGAAIFAVDITERKRAEEAIESLARFPSENPNPILRIGRDGVLLYANEASDALLRGWQLEIGKPAPSVLQEAVSDTLTRQIGITLDTEHDQRIISFFVAPVVKASYANLYGRDVTERRRAEARLYHLNEVLRAVRNVNQLITRERDPQQLMSDACAILVHTRGYRMAWIGLIEAGHPRVMPAARAGQGTDYLDQVTLTWDESETGQGPTGAALRTRRPASCADVTTDPRFAPWREAALQRGFASVAAAPVMYGEQLFGVVDVYADKPEAFDDEEISLLAELAGDLGFALQSIEDEAERKRAEAALQEAEARYRALVEQIPAIVYTDSAEQIGQTLYISPQLKTMVGYDPKAWIADNDLWLKIMQPEDRERVSAEYTRSNETGEPFNTEYRVVTLDGRMIWIRDEAILKRDPSGHPLFWQGIMLDITERKRAEAQLAEQLDELRRWYAVTLGRETRVLDLKREVNELLARAGQPPRYPSAETDNP